MLPDGRHTLMLGLLFAAGCNALLGIEASRQVGPCDATVCADAGAPKDAGARSESGSRADGMRDDAGEAGAGKPPDLDASQASGTDGCPEGTVRCEGSTVQRCQLGRFEASESCSFGCRDGACAGECRPPASRCRGGVHEICNDDWVFVRNQACRGDCANDACVPCEPGIERCASNAIERCRAGGAYEEVLRCDFGCDTACGGYPVGRYRVRRSCYRFDPEDIPVDDAGVCTPRYTSTTQRYAGTFEISADLMVRGDLVRHTEQEHEITPSCIEAVQVTCAELAKLISAQECIADGTACDCTLALTEPLQGALREVSSGVSEGEFCAGPDGSLRLQTARNGRQHVLDLERIRDEHRLQAAPPAERGEFGYQVALDGDVLVVGAPLEDDGAGAAYVLVREGEAFRQTARLIAAPRAPGDHFGKDVAISGDTVVVSAPDHDGPAAASVQDSGSVFVLRRAGDGSLTPEATLRAPQPQAAAGFGWALSSHGGRIAVGAPNESSSARGVGGDPNNQDRRWSGAAFIFRRDASAGWQIEAYIKASNADARDYFGDAVALHEDLLIAGASGEDGAGLGTSGDREDNSAVDRGAAYVFRSSGGAWSEVAYLKATQPGYPANFGAAVALDGRTAVIGAPWDNLRATGVNGTPAQSQLRKSGAAYVYAIRNGAFEAQAFLKADAPQADDNFGHRVAVLGTIALVSARGVGLAAAGADGSSERADVAAGVVYEFYHGASDWTQHRKLQPMDPGVEAGYGAGLTISGATIGVGAHLEDSAQPTRLPHSGSVYVYR